MDSLPSHRPSGQDFAPVTPSSQANLRLEPLTTQHVEEFRGAVSADRLPRESGAFAWRDGVFDAQSTADRAQADRRACLGDMLLVRDTTGRIQGCVHVSAIDWVHGSCSVSLWLLRSAWGKNLGTAVLLAARQWAHTRGLVRVELLIPLTEGRCVEAAVAAGAVQEGTLRRRFLVNGFRADGLLFALS